MYSQYQTASETADLSRQNQQTVNFPRQNQQTVDFYRQNQQTVDFSRQNQQADDTAIAGCSSSGASNISPSRINVESEKNCKSGAGAPSMKVKLEDEG